MHKLFWTDIILILITILGLTYLINTNQISLFYALIIFALYTASKIIGYLILPYSKFEVFLNFLINSSKSKYLSGFELFKTILVALLYIGFLFINPAIWIIESVLVVAMRIWGLIFIKNAN